jgi:hypothetical protein
MGRGRSTLILFVLALGVGGYLYFVESKKPIADENAKKKVFTYDASKINHVQVTIAGGDTTELKKGANDTWTIVKPIEAPADRNSLSEVTTTLANLEEDREVDPNASDLKTYGLAEPHIDVTFNVEGEKEPKRLLLGDKTPAGTGMYAKLPANNRVFLVGVALDTSLNRSAFDFRDKTAFAFDEVKVDSVELASATQTIRLQKTGDDWKLVKPIEAPADYSTVSGLVGQLRSAQMTALKDRPEDLKDLKQYGLDKPQVVVTLGAGTATTKIELGGEADGATVWARDLSKPIVFSVNNGVASELKKTVADLRRKDVFEFRSFNATRFEITRGNATRTFEKVKGTGENAVDTWRQTAPAAKAVDSSNFEGVLLDLSNLRAESFVDNAGPATGLDKPAAVITVKFDEGKKEERVTIGTAGGATYAARSDQPGALKLEAGKFEAAMKKLDAIQ